MKTITNLDPDCICGMSSRCKVHNSDSEAKRLQVNIVFNVCKKHNNGLELDNVAGCIVESPFTASPKRCNVGACTGRAYASFGVSIPGAYIPE